MIRSLAHFSPFPLPLPPSPKFYHQAPSPSATSRSSSTTTCFSLHCCAWCPATRAPTLPSVWRKTTFCSTTQPPWPGFDETAASAHAFGSKLFPVYVQAFKLCYVYDPNGFYCPEVISLWSTIVYEMGAPICMPYLAPIVDLVKPVAASGTVGSIVAILLISNLVRFCWCSACG